MDASPVEVLRTPVTEQCIVRSAEQMNLPLDVLISVMYQEGGKPGQAVRNTNGTYDLGPMQVNTFWLKYFAKRGVAPEELLNNGCINVLAGAYILASEIANTGSLTKGIAQYHSRTKKFQDIYLNNITNVVNKGIGIQDALKRANADFDGFDYLPKVAVPTYKAHTTVSIRSPKRKSVATISVDGVQRQSLPRGIFEVANNE